MKNRSFPLLFLLLFSITTFPQNSNLVPNSGFEICSKYPVAWMADKAAFLKHMQFWTSPNEGSPDVLVNQKLPYLRPPRPHVSMKGYEARTGNVMIGLKTYGCMSYVSHCKEYLQVKLTEPLIPGEEYIAGFWATVLQNSIKSNHLGLALSTARMKAASVAWLHGIKPIIKFEDILRTRQNEWIKSNTRFLADSAYHYLLIGNFFPDSLTQADTSGADLRYSYCMIDDVSLRRVHKYSPFEGQRPEPGVPVVLRNVYFELDRADLLPASHSQLDALATWLSANPEARIELRGHTDSTASESYNLRLAEERAGAVAAYLVSKGVSGQRMLVKTFGERQPAASNVTAGGRQLNRRVEFIILE
jgi:outer membrane protein OmpA-like peptidoglycan-associated protein